MYVFFIFFDEKDKCNSLSDNHKLYFLHISIFNTSLKVVYIRYTGKITKLLISIGLCYEALTKKICVACKKCFSTSSETPDLVMAEAKVTNQGCHGIILLAWLVIVYHMQFELYLILYKLTVGWLILRKVGLSIVRTLN